MRNILIILAAAFMLSACATDGNTILTTPCTPDPALMKKENPLPPITDKNLSEQQIITYWLNDDARLNGVILDKNALIDHINKYCSK